MITQMKPDHFAQATLSVPYPLQALFKKAEYPRHQRAGN